MTEEKEVNEFDEWFKKLDVKGKAILFIGFATVLSIVFIVVGGGDPKPNPCGCIDILSVPTEKVGIGIPLPSGYMSNEDFARYKKCFEAYPGPATAIVNCNKNK